MTEETAETAPGTALVDALNQTGLPNTIKGKVQRAILQFLFCGPGFDYYQEIRARLDIVEGRSRINSIVADELGRQALLDPEFMERAKARLIGDVVQKQANLEAIAVKAEELAEALPDGEAEAAADDPQPSQDWLNAFTKEAELASSEELRERLAKVLAGEAKTPGTFSKATVRFIAEVEKETLEAFTKALQHRVGNSIVIDAENWNQGEWFGIGTLLETEGLISGAGGFTQRTVTLNESGVGFYWGQKMALVLKGKPESKKEVSIWLLTRLGEQVASLLPPTDEIAALTRLSTLIDRADLEMLVSGPIFRQPDGGAQVGHLIVHWAKENDEQSEPVS